MAKKVKQVEAYFFPITLLRSFLDEPQQAMQDFLNYAILKEMEYIQEKDRKHQTRTEADAIRISASLLGTTTHNWQKKEIQKQIKERTKNETKAPFTRLKRSIFWQWEDRYRPTTDKEEPSEMETVSLLCYLGLISVAGKLIDKEVKTTQDLLFARMSGNSKYNDVSSVDERLNKYRTRKRFENLKDAVEEAFNIEFKRGKQRGVNFKVKPHKKR